MTAVLSEPLLIPIGDRIQSLLDALGQPPAWLADKAGMERSTVTRILNRQRANPTPQTLAELAPVLGVSLEQLVAGTDAAARVEDAKNLISRDHYNDAIHQMLEFERKANELGIRNRSLEETVQREQERRVKAESDREHAERERDAALARVALFEDEANRYRKGLERAVADVAALQTQVRELSAAVENGTSVGKVAVFLGGVAAVASVANYLANDAGDGGSKKAKKRPPTGTASSRRRPGNG